MNNIETLTPSYMPSQGNSLVIDDHFFIFVAVL